MAATQFGSLAFLFISLFFISRYTIEFLEHAKNFAGRKRPTDNAHLSFYLIRQASLRSASCYAIWIALFPYLYACFFSIVLYLT